MTVKGRRIFNRRPVCFFAFFLAAGILVAEAFYAIPHLYRLIPLLLAVVVTAGFALKGKLRRAVYLPLAFLIGFLSCTGAADVYDSRLVEDCSGTFTARVSSDIIVRDGMAEFYVEDLVLDGVVTDGECEVRVPLDVPDFGAGDIVVLKGDLTASRHEAFDTFFAADALGGTYHSLRAESAEFLAAGEPDAILKVQLAVAKLFYENTDADTSAVARALVIGDQRSIDDLYYDSIQASGLAHVLSVSGLHITALSTALYFLLGKLRVNKKAALVIVLAISLVYVALCDFVPPAVRSLVMTAVFNFASAFGLKKDSLSSLAAAASLILVFSPFSVMHVGFLLSVFSIFGILMFAEPFKRTLMKCVDRVAPPRAEETVAGLHGVAAIQAGDIPEDPLARLVAEKQAEQAAEELGGRKGIPRLKRKGSKTSARPRESVPRREHRHFAVYGVYLSRFDDHHPVCADNGSSRHSRRDGLCHAPVLRFRACRGQHILRFCALCRLRHGSGLHPLRRGRPLALSLPEKDGESGRGHRPRRPLPHRRFRRRCGVSVPWRPPLSAAFFPPPCAF